MSHNSPETERLQGRPSKGHQCVGHCSEAFQPHVHLALHKEDVGKPHRHIVSAAFANRLRDPRSECYEHLLHSEAFPCLLFQQSRRSKERLVDRQLAIQISEFSDRVQPQNQHFLIHQGIIIRRCRTVPL